MAKWRPWEKAVAGIIIGLPAIALVAGFFGLSAGLDALSVHDLPIQYIDAIGAGLGMGKDAYVQLAVGCEPSRLAPFASEPDGAPICSPTDAEQFDTHCVVEYDMHVPGYIWPWDDLIEVRLSVAGVRTMAIAHYLEAFDKTELGRTGPLNDDGSMVARKKTVAATQCDGYGLIDIRQHYYN